MALAIPDLPATAATPKHRFSLTFGSTGGDYIYDLASDAQGNLIAVGVFWGSIIVGPTALVSAGKGDVLVVKLDPQGNPLWARSYGGATDDSAAAVAIDKGNNILLTGVAQGTVDYGSGPTTGGGGNDLFILKLTPSGSLLWVKRPAASGVDSGHGIAVDSSDNVLVVGNFYGTTTYGTTPLTSAGLGDAVVAKLDPSGQFLWAKRFGGAQLDDARAIGADKLGNVWVTGIFRATVDFGSGPSLTAVGNQDIFALQLDAATGSTKRVRQWGGSGYNQGFDLAVVPSTNNVIIAGSFTGSTNFGGGVVTAQGTDDPFLVMLDSSGQHVWSRTLHGSGTESIQSIAVDSAGRIVAAGTFTGSLDAMVGTLVAAGSGVIDGFVLLTDSLGQPTWAKSLGSTGPDGAYATCWSSSGRFGIAGYFSNSVDFGGGTRSSAGGNDGFVAFYGP